MELDKILLPARGGRPAMILPGDCLTQLKTLPDESVDCCISSPPYYGLRDYGINGQIGLEPSPDEYVGKLVEVFREVRRVLKKEGTLWLNLGDSYTANGKSSPHSGLSACSDRCAPRKNIRKPFCYENGELEYPARSIPDGLKPKDLIGIPWMVAFALRADGWYLRSDIIWHKPNCMPESVTDRPTKSHEYLFLLSKSQRYFYDSEAIKEPNTEGTQKRLSSGPVNPIGKEGTKASISRGDGGGKYEVANGRNKRTVWTIPTKPFPGSHFATFPEKLVEPCILAGTSEKGYCPACGAAWQRVVKTQRMLDGKPSNDLHSMRHSDPHAPSWAQGIGHWRINTVTNSLGWRPSCFCILDCAWPGPQPAVVLDPFFGAGTVGVVAKKLGRRYIGIELNPDYISMAKARVQKIPVNLRFFEEDARP